MGWRQKELESFDPDVIPLNEVDSGAEYNRVCDFFSKTHYGLNETIFAQIDNLDVNQDSADAQCWLIERLGFAELLVVFGTKDVFRMHSTFLIDNWRDMFCPSRDDVIIVPVAGGWALFYCHEDQFEFARLP